MTLQKIDIAAAVIASTMVVGLAVFFQKTRIGRAFRAVADSHEAALSVGISLEQIWVIVWFAAGLVALVTGHHVGSAFGGFVCARNHRAQGAAGSYSGRLYVNPRCHRWGTDHRRRREAREFYWGPLIGGGTESWFAFVIALVFLLFRPQGLFGERIIERV